MKTFINLVLISLVLIEFAKAPNPKYESDVTLTPKELLALKEFRPIIEAKLPTKSEYVNKYVNDDLYLVNLLRANRLNVRDAEKLFDDNLNWRIREKMDEVDKEDWSDMEKEYPVYQNTIDKYGRPVNEVWLTDWPVRTGMLTGKSRRIGRLLSKLCEMNHRRLYDARAEGKQVSRGVLMLELENFNLFQHGCPRCVPIYLQITTAFEKYYPRTFGSLNLLHMPQSFALVLEILKPIMQEDTRKSIKSFVGPEEVQKLMDEQLDRNQRSARYGGTIIREVDN